MDGDGSSTQMGWEKEEAEATNIKAEEAALRLVEDATEDKEKEIETKLKWG